MMGELPSPVHRSKRRPRPEFGKIDAPAKDRIDPNGGDKPEFGKIDAERKVSALAHEPCECVSARARGAA
jgi:hypothetical protein